MKERVKTAHYQARQLKTALLHLPRFASGVTAHSPGPTTAPFRGSMAEEATRLEDVVTGAPVDEGKAGILHT